MLATFLLLAWCAAPAAHAQLGGPNVPEPLTEQPEQRSANEFDDDGGLSGLQQALIFGAAGAVVLVIGLVIVRDARRAAPVRERERRGGAAEHPRERERRRRDRRAKSRAARRQRKRNRAR